jgi:hypothetical protein
VQFLMLSQLAKDGSEDRAENGDARDVGAEIVGRIGRLMGSVVL